MAYDYADHRDHVFTEGGQIMFLQIRDRAKALLDTAGAVSMERLIQGVGGDTWYMLACVDRLVELGELREVTKGMQVAGQHRIFVKA